MAETQTPKRRENQKSPPPSLPATSAPATFPTFSFSKCVSLFYWWLIRAERESQSTGKRLGVAGFTTHGGKLESRVFTSAPIVVRHDAYTVETADGITVRIEGCIDQARSVTNGFALEVCRLFLIGFPYNWEYYADGDVGNNTSILNGSGVFSIRKTADVLRSTPDHSIDNVLKRHFTSTSRKVCVRKTVVDKGRQNCEYIGGSAQMINHDIEGNATSDAEDANVSGRGFDMVGINGERSIVNDKIIMDHNVPFDASLAESEKVKNLAVSDSDALNFGIVSQLPNNDEITTDKTDSTIEGVSNYILPNENHSLQLQQCSQQMSAQKARGNGGHGSDDLQVREDSGRKDTCSTPSKMNLPLEASFSLLSNVTQRNADNKSIPTSGKVASFCSSARQSTLTSPQHWRRLRGYAGSGRHPERIRVDNVGESNDNSINYANPSADSISNDSLPKENDVSHKDQGTILGGYSLRSQNPVGDIGVDKTCSSEGLLERKDSEKANSDLLMVEMNVSLVPLIASDFRNSYQAANLKKEGKDSQKSDTRFTISSKNEITVPLSCPTSPDKSTRLSKGMTSNKIDQIYHNIRNKLEDDLLDCSLTMDTVDVTKTKTSELIESNVRNSHHAAKLKDNSRDTKKSDTRFTVSSKNEIAVPLSCPISPDKTTGASKGIATNEVDEIYVNIRKKFEDNFLSVKDCSSMMDTVHVTKSKTSEVRESLQRKQALSNLKDNQKEDQGAHGHAIEMTEESVSGLVNKLKDNIKEKNPFPGTKYLNSGSTSQNAVHMSRYNTRSRQRKISDSSACKSQSVNEDIHFSCTRGRKILEIPTIDRGSNTENEHRLETVDHNCTDASADVSEIGTIKGARVSSNRRSRNENESPEVLLIKKKVRKLRRNQEVESDALTGAQPTQDKTTNARRQKTVWRPSYSHEPQFPLTRGLAKKFSVTSPTLLDLERSRSGRLLVPQLVKGHQQIIYDNDGTICGITGMDNLLNSPRIGSISEPLNHMNHRRRKLN